MKKSLIAIFALIALVGCSTPKFYTSGNFVDYSKYMEKGFFVSESNSVNFTYTPVGSVSGSCYSGNTSGSTKDKNSLLGKMYNYKFATIEDAMDAMYQIAIEKGANGVINLTFSQQIDKSGRSFITASGMAIKK